MEKKELSLIILGIVAVIAVVGLVLLFKSAMSGAAQIPYQFPQAATYSNTAENPWPYAGGTPKGGNPVLQTPGIPAGIPVAQGQDIFTNQYGTDVGAGIYYPDWNRKRQPELTDVAEKDVCNALARLGEVPKTHTFGASFTMLKDGVVVDSECVQSPRWTQPGSTGTPLCCLPPGAQLR
ncbi:hypothetical protein KY338_06995 [Candidatus Woesearchaeota archaeon]|nr:hypothetical protein [Candidatus Woesearchaeota archaeon]MBW3005394.1 hypothetical protein [Candidatus Woesearchaeota archaeon]